jgi:hypothetical protein
MSEAPDNQYSMISFPPDDHLDSFGEVESAGTLILRRRVRTLHTIQGLHCTLCGVTDVPLLYFCDGKYHMNFAYGGCTIKNFNQVATMRLRCDRQGKQGIIFVLVIGIEISF